jgi:UDP-N-acetylmuramoyl-L-alanyl-D-glutamate--2,6-diaminopimelate ligase
MAGGETRLWRRAGAGHKAMRLSELLAGDAPQAQCPPGADAVEISSVAYDSRTLQPGALFFCVAGFQSDGHRFAGEAIERGAAALVVERPLGLGVPEVQVPSARAAMGPIAARFYGDPTRELQVVGVTGTNGKTTTAYLVRALLEAIGGRCGLLGTVKSVIAGEQRPAARTTPEAIDLQADFRAMLDGGDRACAMEVSSHALALGRTDGVRFAAAIFTNLTQDHLDFHSDMEDYFQAKRRLFSDAPGMSVVNVGDPYGRRLAQEAEGRLVTYAVEADADYSARSLEVSFAGSRFELSTPVGARTVSLPLPGSFNVANALAALAAVHALEGGLDAYVGTDTRVGGLDAHVGVDTRVGGLDALVDALERGVRVPGRFESVNEGQGFAVVVDYAHTPDSLENVLLAARELTRAREPGGARERGVCEPGGEREPGGAREGRVLCVFGAGGDRDRAKRPLMGAIAARLADVVVVTSDNPRSEDPAAIVEEIMAGMGQTRRPPGAPPALVELDRRVAIADAVREARTGDVLVIAGKGHEQGQELENGRKLPFDDVSVAREALRGER